MNLSQLTEKIKNRYKVSAEEAIYLYHNMQVDELSESANQLRKVFDGNKFETCSIINAKSGKCSENCKWCAQSKFYKTSVEAYPLLEIDEIIKVAKHNANHGVERCSLVTSGRKMDTRDIEKIIPIYEYMRDNIDIKLCASMGLLEKTELQKLYNAGCRRYHCNLETAPSFFSTLCSTHTIEDKIQTIKWAQEVGMTICSGGIIGMGETAEQRIELAIILRELNVDSVPINILNPIKGTPLWGTELLKDEDILKTIAIFKIIHPRARIRFAGGRVLITHIQDRAVHGGISAAIVGDLLTTLGIDMEKDLKMLKFREYCSLD